MKKFRAYIAVAILLMVSGVAYAQGKVLLERFYSHLDDSCISFSCSYTYRPSKTSDIAKIGSVTGDASVEIQGGAYIFKGNGLVLTCDGIDVCIMDETAKEVVYEAMPETLSDMDFLQNPAYLIRGLKENFKVQSSSAGTSGGSVTERHVLVPTVNCGISKCTIDLAGKGLSSALFDMADGGLLEVKMNSYEAQPRKDASYFKPKGVSSFNSSWVVTDLR